VRCQYRTIDYSQRYLALVAASILVFAPSLTVALAAEEMRGAKDNAVISRFKDAILIAAAEVPFGITEIDLGPLTFDRSAGRPRAVTRERVEGRSNHYLYVVPDTTAGEEVRRNYEQALQSAGFRLLYSCSQKQCGILHSSVYDIKGHLPRTSWGRVRFRELDFHHIAARDREGRVVLLMLGTYVAPNDRHSGNVAVYQIVVEPQAARLGQVTASAATLDRDIAASGRAAVYGLYFDTNSADLKSESEPQLAEIAKFLRTDLKRQVLIVGHTDNQGSLDYNLVLSRRRAESVVRALVTQHGITSDQLTGKGAGMIAPVASNRTEAGRSKNRRVEIVER
jgi:OmpA-OmpF porin, OOP family